MHGGDLQSLLGANGLDEEVEPSEGGRPSGEEYGGRRSEDTYGGRRGEDAYDGVWCDERERERNSPCLSGLSGLPARLGGKRV